MDKKAQYRQTERETRQWQRDDAKNKKAESILAANEKLPVSLNIDNAGVVLARWAKKKLVVPPGHPKAGKALVLPDYGIEFINDAMTHRESLLCLGRKNAKSAIVAVFCLARLVGPLRIRGYRGGVLSISRGKAAELKTQMRQIAEASKLEGLKFRTVAMSIESDTGIIEIMHTAHASGLDDAIVDELGLLHPNKRDNVASMYSAISARDGRFMALSIRGSAPFTQEMIDRRGDEGVAVHLYAAPPGSALDDKTAWHAANPGLKAGIKALSYMRDAARRALAIPAQQSLFRVHELNIAGSEEVEMIFDPQHYLKCQIPDDVDLPPREGSCYLGLDIGGSASMTASVCIWPETGRLEARGAFPDTPDLLMRGKGDGVGNEYVLMEERGEVVTYPGRVTPCVLFMQDLAADLIDCDVRGVAADRYRRAEVEQALIDSEVDWPYPIFRGQGAAAKADGSADVRATQKMFLRREVKVRESLLMTQAIYGSRLRFDVGGNPALDKAHYRNRIDAVSALVLACGLVQLNTNDDNDRPLLIPIS